MFDEACNYIHTGAFICPPLRQQKAANCGHVCVCVCFTGKVAEELDRLTQALMGPEGLDPDAWNKLPRKLELLAQRNVQRQDMLEKKRCTHTQTYTYSPYHGFHAAVRTSPYTHYHGHTHAWLQPDSDWLATW